MFSHDLQSKYSECDGFFSLTNFNLNGIKHEKKINTNIKGETPDPDHLLFFK